MHASYSNSALVGLAVVFGASLASAAEDETQAYQRGVEHLANGRFGEAVASLDQVITADSKNKQAYRCRGFAHLLRGDPESAIADFSEAIKIDPLDAVLFYGRGSA